MHGVTLISAAVIALLAASNPAHGSDQTRTRAAAQTSTIDAPADTSMAAAADLFAALRGGWSCTGALANGRPLAADLSFTPAMDGRLLRFRHADRAPSSYVQEATWGASPTRHEIVSLAYAAGTATAAPEPALFVAREWTAHSLTLVADTLQSPPWAPNRFAYTVAGPDSLKMVWEVERGGAWRMGDWLACTRAVQ